MAEVKSPYPLSLSIDYPDKLSRLTTFFRIFMIIPIIIVLAFLAGPSTTQEDDSSQTVQSGNVFSYNIQIDSVQTDIEKSKTTEYGAAGVIFLPLVLMILFRKKYPRWWFDWNLAYLRFTMRIGAYFMLLRDEYPSTDEEQAVHLEIAYPDAQNELMRGMPLVKWFLAIPHYVVLFFLGIAAAVCVIFTWFAILFTGRYPRGLFDFVVGVTRWCLRVDAYALILVTDRYPPFSLE